MALLGMMPIEKLQENIQNGVKVSGEIAAILAADTSRIVFEPIREELERELEHPEAKAETVSGVEQARAQELEKGSGVSNEPAVSYQVSAISPEPKNSADSRQLKAESSPVIPATPPAAPPVAKAVRAPTSNAYKAGEPSAARKNVHDDPYRESP